MMSVLVLLACGVDTFGFLAVVNVFNEGVGGWPYENQLDTLEKPRGWALARSFLMVIVLRSTSSQGAGLAPLELCMGSEWAQ